MRSPSAFDRNRDIAIHLFVIPTEVEEWSEWDERHGPLGREGSGE